MDLRDLVSSIPRMSIFSADDIEYTNQKTEKFQDFQDFDEFNIEEIIIDNIIVKYLTFLEIFCYRFVI